MRALAMTGMDTVSMMPCTMSGSLIRETPPWARMSAGTRSRAITATAPASSAILACSELTTSMITPPLSISAIPRLTRAVPVTAETGPESLELDNLGPHEDGSGRVGTGAGASIVRPTATHALPAWAKNRRRTRLGVQSPAVSKAPPYPNRCGVQNSVRALTRSGGSAERGRGGLVDQQDPGLARCH